MQIVEYYCSNVTYKEGPFILRKLPDMYLNKHLCRIEVEKEGCHYPVIPHMNQSTSYCHKKQKSMQFPAHRKRVAEMNWRRGLIG